MSIHGQPRNFVKLGQNKASTHSHTRVQDAYRNSNSHPSARTGSRAIYLQVTFHISPEVFLIDFSKSPNPYFLPIWRTVYHNIFWGYFKNEIYITLLIRSVLGETRTCRMERKYATSVDWKEAEGNRQQMSSSKPRQISWPTKQTSTFSSVKGN